MNTSYWVANRGGVYKDLVSRAYLSPVHGANANMLGLSNVLTSWTGLLHVGIRTIAVPEAAGSYRELPIGYRELPVAAGSSQ